MRVAYLSNQYPLSTHTFIRREILGVEKAGLEVIRVAIRKPSEPLPERADQDEARRTTGLLSGGPLVLLRDMLHQLAAAPLAWLRTAALATRLGWRSHAGLLRHWVYFAESCSLACLLRAQAVQHVHAHFGTNAATVALLSRELGGPPFSFTVHGPEEFDKPEFIHLGEKVARASFVAVITSFAKSQTFRWSAPVHWSKVHVIRCGLNDVFLGSPSVRPPDEPRLVCVARLGTSKGHAVLLDALAQIVPDHPGLELTLVGDGPLRAFLEQRVRSLGLEPNVRFTGWLDEEGVRRSVLAARALVLPSFAEGLPVVIMEALALRRPVISTRIAGIPELLVHGENGWVVSAGSHDELASALREALALTPERLLQLGEAGHRAACSAHDALQEAAKLAALMHASIAAHGH